MLLPRLSAETPRRRWTRSFRVWVLGRLYHPAGAIATNDPASQVFDQQKRRRDETAAVPGRAHPRSDSIEKPEGSRNSTLKEQQSRVSEGPWPERRIVLGKSTSKQQQRRIGEILGRREGLSWDRRRLAGAGAKLGKSAEHSKPSQILKNRRHPLPALGEMGAELLLFAPSPSPVELGQVVRAACRDSYRP